MSPLRRIAAGVLNSIEEVIVTFCMFGITILTFAEVMARYVFRTPIIGAAELTTYLFIWASLFGAAAAFKYNLHGGVPILVDLLPPGVRRIADRLLMLVTTGFFAFLSYYTWLFVQQSIRVGQTSPATGIPAWIVNAGILGALLLCALRNFGVLYRDLTGQPRYRKVPGSRNASDAA